MGKGDKRSTFLVWYSTSVLMLSAIYYSFCFLHKNEAFPSLTFLQSALENIIIKITEDKTVLQQLIYRHHCCKVLLSFESNMAERRKLDVKSLFTMLLHFNFLAVLVFQSWYGSFVLCCALALVPLIRNIWSCNRLKSYYRDCFCVPG